MFSSCETDTGKPLLLKHISSAGPQHDHNDSQQMLRLMSSFTSMTGDEPTETSSSTGHDVHTPADSHMFSSTVLIGRATLALFFFLIGYAGNMPSSSRRGKQDFIKLEEESCYYPDSFNHPHQQLVFATFLFCVLSILFILLWRKSQHELALALLRIDSIQSESKREQKENEHFKAVIRILRNDLQKAHKATKAEREMINFLAHEVRNPLAAAMSALCFVSSAVPENVLLSDNSGKKHNALQNDRSTIAIAATANAEAKSEKISVAIHEDLEIIKGSLDYINDLLRSTIDMQRIVNGQIKIVRAPTDVLTDVLRPVSCLIYRRNADFSIQVECIPENLVIQADRLRLTQVVMNLVRNSAKFVNTGFVRIRAQVVTVPKGTTTTTEAPGELLLSERVQIIVEDSGAGIPPEKMNSLFSRYQDSLDSLSQGTGLGLNLCKNLVELMGGKIWLDKKYHSGIENAPGCRFVIDLNTPPVHMGRNSKSFETIESPKVKLSKRYSLRDSIEATTTDPPLPEKLNLLFVDDDTVLRKLFCRAVKRAQPGWTITEAASGEAALQLIHDEEEKQQQESANVAKGPVFDLIFMDQYMASVQQRLLGTETVMALRSKHIDSIIVGLSANDAKKSFLQAGADAFMFKPISSDPTKLRKELQRILRSRNQ